MSVSLGSSPVSRRSLTKRTGRNGAARDRTVPPAASPGSREPAQQELQLLGHKHPSRWSVGLPTCVPHPGGVPLQ